MPQTFTKIFDTPTFKGEISVNTGLFIDGAFVDAVKGGTVDIVNPAIGELITTVAAGTKEDVDIAVKAAQKAYKTSWGLKIPGAERGRLISKLADLFDEHMEEFIALEALDVGKIYSGRASFEFPHGLACLRHFAGWADKVHGKTIETNEMKLAYTRHEPYGVVGAIIPWNLPTILLIWKIAPALAAGNTIVVKPSEVTPLTALKMAELITEAGFPPGVFNIVNGHGHIAGQAIAEHPDILKISFTGSTAVGRKIQEASARSNLKHVSLELGGKSPNIIFDDADLEQALKWSSLAVFNIAGQMCSAGSRILVQEGIYDKFCAGLTAIAKAQGDAHGDPFSPTTRHGPQSSQAHMDRILGYLEIAKKEGAEFLVGGERIESAGYYIAPTIMVGNNSMTAFREEIFGPVAAVIKFKTEEEALEIANDTDYGLAASVFTQNNSRAIRVAHALEAGSAFINTYNTLEPGVPFGGYKMSGVGRELGEYAIETYTRVKAVHVNIGMSI